MDDIDNSYLISVLEQSRTKLLDPSRRIGSSIIRRLQKISPLLMKWQIRFLNALLSIAMTFFLAYEAEEDIEEVPDRTLPQSLSQQDREDKHNDNYLQTPYSEKDLERRIRKLYYEHRSIIEETGGNNLYLAIGSLEWSDEVGEGRMYRSPLLLVPVRLEKDPATSGRARNA